jgi:hypothetical protein
MHTLRRGLGGGTFADTTTESGMGFPTLPFVGFGVAFLDVDNDTRLDVAVVNGHILENAPQFRAGSTYAQRMLLFRNTTGRRFAEVGRNAGAAWLAQSVGRGLATGDFDNDDDLDLLVTGNGREARLLRNDGGNRAAGMIVRLQAAPGQTSVGARIHVATGQVRQSREVKAGSSYASQSDLRAHFGLGAATLVDRIDVVWSSGRKESVGRVPANQIVTIEEAKGIVDRAAFSR